jgi:hypothetical protein
MCFDLTNSLSAFIACWRANSSLTVDDVFFTRPGRCPAALRVRIPSVNAAPQPSSLASVLTRT